jgi:trehalose 6-phosphate phosphatase
VAAEALGSIEPLRPLLSQRPLGLASDIDGTLAPIVPVPEEASLSPRCRRALAQLMERGVAVALVTGRDLGFARRMVGLDGAVYAANHGLSLWLGGREETPDVVREYVEQMRRVMAEVGEVRIPGVSVENKGPVLAFHYRRAADAAAARETILATIQACPSAAGLRVHEGRKVVELRPPVAVDKGTALAHLAERLGLAAVICLGDDTTDIDMFRAVARMREAGRPGISIAVESEETTAELMAAADYSVRGVEGVEWLLTELVRALPGRGP